MLQLLEAPTPGNTNFYEASRLRLTWNIHLLLIALIVPLILVSLITQPFYAIVYGVSLLLLSVSLLFIKFKGNYRVFSTCAAIALYITILFSMFTVDEQVHYIESFWLLVLVLYIYFIHGKFWGALAMVGTLLSTGLFFVFNLNVTIGNINNMTLPQELSMALELLVCLFLIGYIVHQFIFLKSHAELELKIMNAALRKEKNLIENRDKEKTILLQEIHHRVKNNLQIVMSLLRTQSNKIESTEAHHFNDAINQVLTMSLIHQKLYENKDLSAVNLFGYIESLASDILRSTQPSSPIEKSFSIDVQKIGVKTIVPIALIVTELISNSAKHAFDITVNPEISLSISVNDSDNTLELIYSDNGTWKESNHDSFGTQLIQTLTEQLEGSYELSKDVTGTKYTFQLQQLD